LDFEFKQFLSVTGQTGPIYRNWWAAVSSHQSVKKNCFAPGDVEETGWLG